MSSVENDVNKGERWTLGYISSVIIEHVLLGFALGFLIPPAESTNKRQYFPGTAIVVMLVPLIASRYLAIRRNEETVFGSLLKVIIFCIACIAIHARCYMN